MIMKEVDPDKILEEIERQEQLQKLAKLKIFFGMSAGVGKTYAMLEEAHEKLKEGLDVVVGVVNTHGRKETEDLLKGLTVLPKKWMTYKDNAFEEFDIDAVLKLKPQIVLVDELAHTNVPGSRHPKRWQDVVELLDAGISVYTTLNVQHIESRKDIIESLTGISIRETVPDIMLERAHAIEFIDISPSDLLQRLKEGKVYLGDQSRIAAENFFKEGNLTALREIALRLTAEKVDHDLHGLLLGGNWRSREKLLLGISPYLGSESLIRSARKLAFEIDAPWVVTYVDTGIKLDKKEEARLERYFNLARELGAEIVTTKDVDVAEGLKRIASQKEVTRILIGRTQEKRSIFKKDIYKRLEKDIKNVDLILLRRDKVSDVYQRTFFKSFSITPLINYFFALLQVIVTACLGYFLMPYIGDKPIGFLFLLGLAFLALFVTPGPIFLSAVLSAAIWMVFFATPLNTEDIAFVVIYFITAMLMGLMTGHMRKRDRVLKLREERSARLYEVSKIISESPNIQSLKTEVAARLERLFPGTFEILFKNSENVVEFDSSHPFLKDDKEKFTILWVMQKGTVAGAQTDTLPSARGIYFPISYSKSILGVLAYYPEDSYLLTFEDRNFIQTVTDQVGVYLERTLLAEGVTKQEITKYVEKLYKSLLQIFNRGFYEPFDNIIKIHRSLSKLKLGSEAQALLSQAEQNIAELVFTQNNIAAMAELESGFVHLEKMEKSIKELVDTCVNDIKPIVNKHRIVYVPKENIVFNFDFRLMRLALNNILINTLHYSSEGGEIKIDASKVEDRLRLSISYDGRGIQEELLAYMFENFFRITIIDERISMTRRLGLSIVKAVVEVHSGAIEIENRVDGGTTIVLVLT